MSGKVYSYTRFSDPRQATGHSADRQAAYAAKWAKEHGLVLDESLTLRDEGLSAYHQRHVRSGALGLFLQAVESGMIAPGSVLVVEGLDRLSRAEPIQAQAQLAQIVNAGITVVTASDGKSYSRERLKANPMDLVYSLLVMIRAHEESDTKSKRVTASIRKLCEKWMDGTYRGLIRNGKDPAWLRLKDREIPGPDKWELVPERVEAVRKAVQLYCAGYSSQKIIAELDRLGLLIGLERNRPVQIYRLMKEVVMIGTKELTIAGETFMLQDYYPPILTREEWDELRACYGGRPRKKLRGELPGVVAGQGILRCGYCGEPMTAQNYLDRKRLPDGRVRDSYRQLRCMNNYHGSGCACAGSISAAPVERAIMSYCSDLMNLRSLYGGDRSAEPRARLAKSRTALADIEARLDRLMEAILSGDNDTAPAIFAAKARALEVEQKAAQKAIEDAERELANVARINLKGVDELWRSLAEGVEAQDYDARIKARKLVGETFESITLYWRGLRPKTTPKGTFDMVLVAKGGVSRALRVKGAGEWVAGDEVELA